MAGLSDRAMPGGAQCQRCNAQRRVESSDETKRCPHLGYRSGGEIVEVTLSGNSANVRLMDSSNFSNYKNGRQHSYRGGLAKQSPVRLQIVSK